MKNYSNTFQHQIEKTIEQIEEKNLEPEFRLKEIYAVLEKHIFEMNDWLKTYTFSDEKEEIYFFKYIRPQIVAKLFFYKTQLAWESKMPIQDLDKKQFYIQKHNEIEQELNGLHYIDQYYTTNSSFNDTNYFMRHHNLSVLSIYTEEYINYDSRLCTPQCIAVAKLLNYKMLIAYLKSKFECKCECETKPPHIAFKKLKWNYNKQDIFELIFSLHYSNAVGDEKTPLIKIIEAFEMIFDKELKADTYKRLSNQKKRKKESTPFLNKISSILTIETQKT